jgi:serine/threonine protein kinase
MRDGADQVDPPGADDIVRRAQSIDDPAERAALLDRECGDDSRLRAEVEARLLRGDTETSGLTATTGLDEPIDGPRLKVIKPGMDSRQIIARFTAERQALAVMDHPGIAKVFDAGTTETGRPYFVMELGEKRQRPPENTRWRKNAWPWQGVIPWTTPIPPLPIFSIRR